jgi:hypothetical protein
MRDLGPPSTRTLSMPAPPKLAHQRGEVDAPVRTRRAHDGYSGASSSRASSPEAVATMVGIARAEATIFESFGMDRFESTMTRRDFSR